MIIVYFSSFFPPWVFSISSLFLVTGCLSPRTSSQANQEIGRLLLCGTFQGPSFGPGLGVLFLIGVLAVYRYFSLAVCRVDSISKLRQLLPSLRAEMKDDSKSAVFLPLQESNSQLP